MSGPTLRLVLATDWRRQAELRLATRLLIAAIPRETAIALVVVLDHAPGAQDLSYGRDLLASLNGDASRLSSVELQSIEEFTPLVGDVIVPIASFAETAEHLCAGLRIIAAASLPQTNVVLETTGI